MRLAVFADFGYRRDDGGGLHAEESFAVFIAGLGRWCDEVTLVGRLDPEPGTWRHPLPDGTRVAGLPFYGSLARPRDALRAMGGALRRWWQVLGEVDAVWVTGPHPLGVLFVLLAWLRGRRVALGVRQDLPAYVRNRRGDRPALVAAALVLEAAWRVLALRCRVVAVGPELARQYRHAPAVLDTPISLVPEARLSEPPAPEPPREGPARVLSVGRIDPEKNPLLLADIAALLGDEVELVVCGEGQLREALEARLRELGARADLRGYVPVDGGLLDLYRTSHLFLHVSHTEGMSQVLVEAFVAGLPVVATAVGGIPAFAGDAAVLIPPRDADAAARAVRRVLGDEALRSGNVERGRAIAREHTLERTTRRVADFLSG